MKEFLSYLQPSGRSVYQIDLVPTVAFSLGIPIPFSNLGMLIPEVFLPHHSDNLHAGSAVNGYEGRVSPEFLTALDINARQLQLYLATYIQHSNDFPHNVYEDLEGKLGHAVRLHEAIQNQRDGKAAQKDLTNTATAYVEYMKDVKTMCQSVWAKFDNTPINKGLLHLTLSVCITLISLLDVEHSVHSMQKSVSTGFSIGTVLGLGSVLVEHNQLEFGLNDLVLVIITLLFYSLTISSLLYLWNFRKKLFNILQFVLSWRNILLFISHITFIDILAIVITLLYSVSLLSNSFIAYEGDVVIFFVQTMAVCFAVIKLKQEFQESKEQRATPQHLVKRILKTVTPFVLLMVCVRATKLFHSCRDLQVGCEPTTFILALPTASELLGGALSKCRFLLSCLAIGSVPLTLAVCLHRNKTTWYLNTWLVTIVKFGSPIAVLCVVGFWAIQTFSQSLLEALPHWQHVILPRTVYCFALTTVTLCVLQPFKKRAKALVCEDSNVLDTYMDEVETARTDLPAEANKQSARLRKPDVSDISSSFFNHPPRNLGVIGPQHRNLVAFVLFILLIAIWLPITMILNDGLALSSVLTVAQIVLCITALERSNSGKFRHTIDP